MKSSLGNIKSQTGKTFWRYCYTISHSVLLYTCPHIKDTYPALFIIIDSIEFVFFSNNACLPLNTHHSPADLTQYLFSNLVAGH